MGCEFPHTNTTGTCITYADYIGTPYYDWRLALIIMTAILSFINLVQLIRFKFFSVMKNDTLLFRTLILSFMMCLSMTIESIDPEGYMGIIPHVVETLASNLSTCFGLIIILNLFFSLDLLHRSVYEHINKFIHSRTTLTAIIFVFCFTIMFTLLQVYINEFVFRAIKYLGLCIILIISGAYLHNIIKRSINCIIDEPTPDVKRKVNRTVAHLICFDIFIAVISLYLFYASIVAFTKIGTKPKPELTSASYVFPICQLFAIILSLSFTWVVKNNKMHINLELPYMNFIRDSFITRLPIFVQTDIENINRKREKCSDSIDVDNVIRNNLYCEYNPDSTNSFDDTVVINPMSNKQNDSNSDSDKTQSSELSPNVITSDEQISPLSPMSPMIRTILDPESNYNYNDESLNDIDDAHD